MTLTVYHRTTIADARAIAKNGFEDRELDFGLHDVVTGEEVTIAGVWLCDRTLASDEGPGGDAMLEIRLDVEDEALQAFELEGLFWDARVWVAPAEWVTAHAKVRIFSVDPSTSGSFDIATGDQE
jgi:hypothetical protein